MSLLRSVELGSAIHLYRHSCIMYNRVPGPSHRSEKETESKVNGATHDGPVKLNVCAYICTYYIVRDCLSIPSYREWNQVSLCHDICILIKLQIGVRTQRSCCGIWNQVRIESLLLRRCSVKTKRQLVNQLVVFVDTNIIHLNGCKGIGHQLPNSHLQQGGRLASYNVRLY